MPQHQSNIPSVLIIDDGTLTRSVLKNILIDIGCTQIWAACSGGAGMDLYTKYNPDLVYLDVNMPGLNGHEILKKLKSTNENVYVVMVTSEATKDNLDAAVANGAKGFIVKPFQAAKIEQSLKAYHKHQLTASRS